MSPERIQIIKDLVVKRIETATAYLEESRGLREAKKSFSEAEIPGFEGKPMKFGQFQEREFVALMTDIRKSTDIINSIGGTEKMFKIFYAYSAVVANIVDHHNGTATEFLGDGVLNLFELEPNRDQALRNSMLAGWDILYATTYIMNPAFYQNGLPSINIGIGVDYGDTIVTRFGDKTDNDLKAFGKCVYNVSRLCKGVNTILVSEGAKLVWPTAPDGNLLFEQTYVNNAPAYKASAA